MLDQTTPNPSYSGGEAAAEVSDSAPKSGGEAAAGFLPLSRGRQRGSERESKATIDFAVMMAEYCLEQQIKAFGEAMESQFVDARDECVRYGRNHSIYDQLAPTFTMDDLRALKRGFCGEAALRKIISRWYRDRWIEKTDKTHWRKL
jgi:hypothetical protein